MVVKIFGPIRGNGLDVLIFNVHLNSCFMAISIYKNPYHQFFHQLNISELYCINYKDPLNHLFIYIYIYLYVNGSRKKTTSTNKHLQIDPQKSSILPAKVRPSDFTFGPRHRRPGRCGRRHPGAPRPRPAWWSPAHPWAPARCPEPLRSFGGNSENHGKTIGKW